MKSKYILFILVILIFISCSDRKNANPSRYHSPNKKTKKEPNARVKNKIELYQKLEKDKSPEFSKSDFSPEGFNYIHYDFARFISKTVYSHNFDDVIKHKSAIAKEEILKIYIKSLQTISKTSFSQWKNIHQKSFLINAYHAFIMKKMLASRFKNLSIKTSDEPGSINLFNKKFSFNSFIDKEILPRFPERSLILSLHCFSDICPEYRNKIYNFKNIEHQLNVSAFRYFRHPKKVMLDKKKKVIQRGAYLKKYAQFFPKSPSEWKKYLLKHYSPKSEEYFFLQNNILKDIKFN